MNMTVNPASLKASTSIQPVSQPRSIQWLKRIDHNRQAASKSDPAIIEIAQYWNAIEAWRSANQRVKRLSRKLPPELMRKPRIIIGWLLEGTDPNTEEKLRSPIYAHSEWDVEQSVKRDCDHALSFGAGPSWVYKPKAKGADKNGYVQVVTDRAKKARPIIRAKYRARLKEKLAAFHADKAALFERQRAAGWRQAVEAEDVARRSIADLRYKAVMAIPTTMDGAIALLDFSYKAHRMGEASKVEHSPHGLSDYYHATVARNVAGFLR